MRASTFQMSPFLNKKWQNMTHKLNCCVTCKQPFALHTFIVIITCFATVMHVRAVHNIRKRTSERVEKVCILIIHKSIKYSINNYDNSSSTLSGINYRYTTCMVSVDLQCHLEMSNLRSEIAKVWNKVNFYRFNFDYHYAFISH